MCVWQTYRELYSKMERAREIFIGSFPGYDSNVTFTWEGRQFLMSLLKENMHTDFQRRTHRYPKRINNVCEHTRVLIAS